MSTRPDAPDGAFWGDVDEDVALSRYRTLVNTIDDGVYQLDPDGRFVAVNDVIVETTGRTRDDLLGEHVSIVLTDHDVERIERELERQIGTEDTEIATFELGIQTVDGGVVPCELRINLLIESGEFQGTIGVARDLSEEKQRLESLESARASYDSITSVLDEANIGVFVLDDAFDVAWADETIERYFGLDRDDLIGRDKRRVVHELVADTVDDPDRFAATVLATYDDNSYIEEFECHVTAGDDREERWLEHRSKPIESGQYAGGRIELYYDITDRKRSEDARRETEEQFRSLVDAVEEDAIFRLDPEGHVISWNEGAKRIKGYDSEEILGEHFSTFYTEEDRDANVPERNLERATESGSIEDEGWRVRKDGTRFWGNVTITAVRDDGGTHHGYLKITRDVTDRIERERELESELQQVFERVSDGFFAVDEEYRFTHVNERAEQLLEHSEGELLGESIWEEFPAIDRLDGVRNAFEGAMRSQEPDRLEFYNDDLEFWVQANLYPSETGLSVYFRDVSERKEREQELRKYETIVETSPVGITIVDSDGEMQYANGRAEEIFARSRTQINNLAFEDPEWDEVDRDGEPISRDELPFPRIMESGEPLFDQISGVLRPDGERVWISVNGVPVHDDRGEITSVVFAIDDVTERREREQQLEQFERMVETVNDGVYVTDGDGRIVFVNDAFVSMSQHTREELLGAHGSAFFGERFVDTDEEEWRELVGGERDSVNFETEIVGPHGEVHVVHNQFVTLEIDDEMGRVGVTRDITKLKQYQRKLEESERRYRTLVENFPNGAVGLFDDDLRYTTIGGELLDATGVSPEDRIGNSVYDLYPDDIVAEIEPYFEAALEGEANSFEVEYNDRNLFAYTLPLRNEDEAVFAGMLVVQDVTERREYQRKLEESNERLEQFAYAASHDLQEPLRMVTSYLQLIEKRYGDALDEDGEEFIEFAVDGAERMRGMIDGLLKYSRIETRGDPFEPVDLDDVLGDVREDLQMRIDESNAEITTDDLPCVDGDDSQLRQVFQNLLSNAIEYGGDESPRIDISATRDDERWIISVQDDGIGIDPDEQERIFEVFQRLHTHEEHSGTGLGLALSHRIVERHGGEIWVESEPDEGSTFSFTLPAVDT